MQNKCQPSLSRLEAAAMDPGGNKRSALSCERACVRSCVLPRSLTSSRLYNTLINTYTVGWYNRTIRLLLVFYVHNSSKSQGYLLTYRPTHQFDSLFLNLKNIYLHTYLPTYLPINLDHDILILRMPTYLLIDLSINLVHYFFILKIICLLYLPTYQLGWPFFFFLGLKHIYLFTYLPTYLPINLDWGSFWS
jgi:hypothetical protein